MLRSRRSVLLAGLITLVGMGGLGTALMVFFQSQTPTNLLQHGEYSFGFQCLTGLLYGLSCTLALLVFIRASMMDPARQYFSKLLQGFNLRIPDIIFISFCAGVGEELLFRGALQTWLGIWPTAILFVALHGYLDPRDKAVLWYGIGMTLVCGGFGYLTQLIGLWSAAMAHTIIDIGLLLYLRKQPAQQERL